MLTTIVLATSLFGCSLYSDLNREGFTPGDDRGDVPGGDAAVDADDGGTPDTTSPDTLGDDADTDGGADTAHLDADEPDTSQPDVPSACPCDDLDVCIDDQCRPAYEAVIFEAPVVLGGVTGGAGGDVCEVSAAGAQGPGTLNDCLQRERPLWILFEEGLENELQVGHQSLGSHVTLDGRGWGRRVRGTLDLNQSTNVIVHNLGVVVPAERDTAITVLDGRGIWMDRVSVGPAWRAVQVGSASRKVGITRSKTSPADVTVEVNGEVGETPEASTQVFVDHFQFLGDGGAFKLTSGYLFVSNGRIEGGVPDTNTLTLRAGTGFLVQGVTFGGNGSVAIDAEARVRTRSIFLDPDMETFGDQMPDLVPDPGYPDDICQSAADCNERAIGNGVQALPLPGR
jgi:hypothetical protein